MTRVNKSYIQAKVVRLGAVDSSPNDPRQGAVRALCSLSATDKGATSSYEDSSTGLPRGKFAEGVVVSVDEFTQIGDTLVLRLESATGLSWRLHANLTIDSALNAANQELSVKSALGMDDNSAGS
jgi:hypothetical protein